MRYIGDIHGNWNNYIKLTEGATESIQVGDFGIGFGDDPTEDDSPRLGASHRFIRGNHDNPALCQLHPNYIGDCVVEGNTFFMGGALSIDRDRRIEGHDYWSDEQLSYTALNDAIYLYNNTKPEIVVTHDCPAYVKPMLFSSYMHIPSRTCSALEQMFFIHQPKLYIFGHWHTNIKKIINGTTFICVANNYAIDIDL